MSALSNRIRQARRGASLSQGELALAVGVGRSAVSQWEKHDGPRPTSDHLASIATATGVAYEWLATGRGNRWLASAGDGGGEAPAMVLNFYAQCELEERLLLAFRGLGSEEQPPFVTLVEALSRRG